MWNQSVFAFGNYAEEEIPISILLNFGRVVSPEQHALCSRCGTIIVQKLLRKENETC